jgi:hypothetical protein
MSESAIEFVDTFCDTFNMAAIITAPFATPERAAEVLGVSKTRAAKLMRWARESLAQGSIPETGTSPIKTNDKPSPRKKEDK